MDNIGTEVVLHPFYREADIKLAKMLGGMNFLSQELQTLPAKVSVTKVHSPCDGTGKFLHETAITVFNGVIYASWYNCPTYELEGYTPIVGRRSFDGGKTWTEPEIIAEDKSERILYCPPVYGVSEGRLYMLINQMVAPDHIHSLDLYVLKPESDRFELVWSRPIPFKLNTNAVTLPNGKLMLCGRIAELDGFPNTPAVMISDDGRMDCEWRLVKVAPNGDFPDGEKFLHPEVTVIENEGRLYLFSRNDHRSVPLVYTSDDLGESWSGAFAHDIPYVNSKIYSGNLSDGRSYLIANIDDFARTKLVLFISEKGSVRFTKRIVLAECREDPCEMTACHYPAAFESDGKLYVIATANYGGRERGAVMFTVEI